ncbi:hypothetical protein EC991_011210 [Linnemannia zychae]|nr:hypothetical protein EC991_011210 [Linnemannia zychae]
MADLIIEIPDDVGIVPDHEESIVETLQIQVESLQDQSNNLVNQPPLTKNDRAIESQAGEPPSSEGSDTLTPDAEISSHKADEPDTMSSASEPFFRYYFEGEAEPYHTNELDTFTEGLYDIVLGVSVKDFNIDAVEAIIITLEQNVGTSETYKSEVISPAELKRLCAGVPNKYADAKTSDTIENDASKNAETNKEDSPQSENESEVATVKYTVEGAAAIVTSPVLTDGGADHNTSGDMSQGIVGQKEEKEGEDGGEDKEEKEEDGGEDKRKLEEDGGEDKEKKEEDGGGDKEKTGGEETGKSEEKLEEVDTILWWKLRENFLTQTSEGDGSADIVIQIKTWNDTSSDYGTFKLHSVDLHQDAHQYFKDKPEYREHQPCLRTVDINRSGYPAHDKFEGAPKRVSGYSISEFGTHMLMLSTSGTTKTLQLWDLRDPTDIAAAALTPSADSTDPKSRRVSTSSEAKLTEKTPRPSMDPHAAVLERSARPSTESSGSKIAVAPLLTDAPVTSLLEDGHVLTRSSLDKPVDPPSDEESLNDATIDPPQVPTPKRPYPISLLAWMNLSEFSAATPMYSLSADATQIVIQDVTMRELEGDKKKDYKSLSMTLQYAPNEADRLSADLSTGFGFAPLDIGECWSTLKNFFGKADFHITNTNAPDVKDELFFTYDGAALEMYSVIGQWKHIRRIIIEPSLYPTTEYIKTYAALTKQLRGKYFMVENADQTHVTTWDVEEGKLVSFITNLPDDQYYALSNLTAVSRDGTLIAIPGKRYISLYRTTTWTLIGTCVLDEIELEDRITETLFVNFDSQLIVSAADGGNEMHLSNKDFIINVKTMKVEGRFVAIGSDVAVRSRPLVLDDQLLAWIGDSTLDIVRYQDRVINSPIKARSRCNDKCYGDKAFRKGEIEKVSSGLTFKVARLDTQVKSYGQRDIMPLVTATVTDQNGIMVTKLEVPFPEDAVFVDAGYFCDCKYLSVVLDTTAFVWSAPTSTDNEFRLLNVQNIDEEYKVNICSHEQLYWKRSDIETDAYVALSIEQPCCYRDTYGFLNGVLDLQQMYESAGSTLKKDIIRYVGEGINMYPDPNVLKESIVPYLCSKWTPDNHVYVLAFITALLESSNGRWVPLVNMPDTVNPIRIMLDHASTHPKAIAVAEVIIKYCIRLAKEDKDPHFLEPVRHCLHDLTDPKKPYSEVALKTLRGFGYFPARARRVILEYHAIAHPHELRWNFWRPNTRGLHQYKDQVLHLTPKPTVNAPKGNFTRDLFTASFDLLWHKTGPEVEPSEEPTDEVKSTTIFSWPMAFISVIRRKLRLTHNATVECHSFEIEALDNPALAALVEYKWFLAQCCFYGLVLTAVLMQTYGFDDNGVYEGIFIVIVVSSIAFLWLEILQLAKDRRGYIQSIYNSVDLLAFLFPLAGSIYQLCVIWGSKDVGLNPPLLSFSVLFIFLHFLFELRVIRSVCQFVSIIIKAISSIRVFFFVFAGGLLGFAIAILHLLHSCIDKDCEAYTEGFSMNMFRGISMTYFMMGGRYDPIANEFSTNNVGFHLMMIVFFFFTVILMLNVLIALINHAIDDGDQTWQLDWLQNRMRFVESAENMTYDIPGFRTSNSWFPETIYYTGTPQKVRDYEKETRRLEDESAPVAVSVTVAEDVKDGQVNLGSSDGALIAMLKQYHEDQKKNLELQKEQFDEQKQTIVELRNELQFLRERLVQQK